MKVPDKIKTGKVQLLVFDFDGVMTDNRVLVDQDGKEAVFVNRSDGLAISMLKEKGYRMIILSTEKNPVVFARATKLNLDAIYGTDNKKGALKNYCEKIAVDLSNVLYVGNDINDLEVMRTVGTSVVPADAYPEAKEVADIVLSAKGGHGVIRELYALLVHNKKY